MKVEVVVPEEYIGDVLGQISARRGVIQGMEMRPGNAQAARAMVPLAEMFGYATELRSVTQGRGVFSMEFDHYAPVSATVANKILNLTRTNCPAKEISGGASLLWPSRNLTEASRI